MMGESKKFSSAYASIIDVPVVSMFKDGFKDFKKIIVFVKFWLITLLGRFVMTQDFCESLLEKVEAVLLKIIICAVPFSSVGTGHFNFAWIEQKWEINNYKKVNN